MFCITVNSKASLGHAISTTTGTIVKIFISQESGESVKTVF